MANVTKTYNILIRVAILAGAYGYLAWKLFIRPGPALSAQQVYQLFAAPGFLPGLLVVLALMLLNWGIETLKWKLLIDKIQKISFVTSVVAVLTGVTVSVFTPNRMGEYIGRVFILRNRFPVKGILVTLLGSLSQIVVYFVCGVAGLGVMFFVFVLPAHPEYVFLKWVVAVGSVLAIVAALLGFLNLSLLSRLIRRVLPRRWMRARGYVTIFRMYRPALLTGILTMSLLRYAVFTFQYIYLLWLFGLDISTGEALMATSVIFFLLVIIPSVALSELGVRNSVALTILGVILGGSSQPEAVMNLAIVSTATTLWVINVGLPALAGSIFVYRLKFFQRRNGN